MTFNKNKISFKYNLKQELDNISKDIEKKDSAFSSLLSIFNRNNPKETKNNIDEMQKHQTISYSDKADFVDDIKTRPRGVNIISKYSKEINTNDNIGNKIFLNSDKSENKDNKDDVLADSINNNKTIEVDNPGIVNSFRQSIKNKSNISRTIEGSIFEKLNFFDKKKQDQKQLKPLVYDKANFFQYLDLFSVGEVQESYYQSKTDYLDKGEHYDKFCEAFFTVGINLNDIERIDDDYSLDCKNKENGNLYEFEENTNLGNSRFDEGQRNSIKTNNNYKSNSNENSLSNKNNKDIETQQPNDSCFSSNIKSKCFKAMCNHKLCNLKTEIFKPKIINSFYFKDSKEIEINNILASMCFPIGIKLCYEKEYKIPAYQSNLLISTTLDGSKYYLQSFISYQKVNLNLFKNKLNSHDINFNKKILKDIVYMPIAFCLISKYPFASQMEIALISLVKLLSNIDFNKEEDELKNELLYLDTTKNNTTENDNKSYLDSDYSNVSIKLKRQAYLTQRNNHSKIINNNGNNYKVSTKIEALRRKFLNTSCTNKNSGKNICSYNDFNNEDYNISFKDSLIPPVSFNNNELGGSIDTINTNIDNSIRGLSNSIIINELGQKIKQNYFPNTSFKYSVKLNCSFKELSNNQKDDAYSSANHTILSIKDLPSIKTFYTFLQYLIIGINVPIISEKKIAENNNNVNENKQNYLQQFKYPYRVFFYVPYFNYPIEIYNPVYKDLKQPNYSFSILLEVFSIETIIYIFNLILLEKKIIFVVDTNANNDLSVNKTFLCNSNTLTRVLEAFSNIIYPISWINTFIPILSRDLIKYIQSPIPFLMGLDSDMICLCTEYLVDCSDVIYFIYLNNNIVSNTLSEKMLIKEREIIIREDYSFNCECETYKTL